MQKGSGSSQEFKPRVGVIVYGGPTQETLKSLSNQTYRATEIRASTDTDSFLSALTELGQLVDIFAFCKGGSSWHPERIAELVQGFYMDPPSIGIVYTDYVGLFNSSFSVEYLNNPDLLLGDYALSVAALHEKEMPRPKEVDRQFFVEIMRIVSKTHISIHVPKVLGEWN
jgi:hypothetical protein